MHLVGGKNHYTILDLRSRVVFGLADLNAGIIGEQSSAMLLAGINKICL